jgi:hypothetical protein
MQSLIRTRKQGSIFKLIMVFGDGLHTKCKISCVNVKVADKAHWSNARPLTNEGLFELGQLILGE